MSSRVIKRTLVASIVLTAASIAQGQHHDSGLVIENVTLISPERRAPLEHAYVVIRDGRIAEVGTKLVPGPQVRRIDGTGRFLIP